jgi:hypothetical protein
VQFDPHTAFPVPHNRPLCHLSCGSEPCAAFGFRSTNSPRFLVPNTTVPVSIPIRSVKSTTKNHGRAALSLRAPTPTPVRSYPRIRRPGKKPPSRVVGTRRSPHAGGRAIRPNSRRPDSPARIASVGFPHVRRTSRSIRPSSARRSPSRGTVISCGMPMARNDAGPPPTAVLRKV